MVYLLLGKDDFTVREYLDELSGGQIQKALVFDAENTASTPPQIWSAYINSDLFGGRKTILARGLLRQPDFAGEFFDMMQRSDSKESANTLVFIEESLDKRKKETKEILNNKDLKVLEFEVPSGENLKKWVVDRAKKMNLNLSGAALDLFLERISGKGTGKDLYDLWQVNSELLKLRTFAGEAPVAVEEVDALVEQNFEEDVFAITNAIGDKNKYRAVSLLTDYFEKIGGDEKGKIIALSAILSEQFRGILIIKDFLQQGMSDAQIAKEMDFTPGRVFIYKKIAQRFSEEKLLDALKKFEALDEEVKTSNGPAALQFFMIIDSLLR